MPINTFVAEVNAIEDFTHNVRRLDLEPISKSKNGMENDRGPGRLRDQNAHFQANSIFCNACSCVV